MWYKGRDSGYASIVSGCPSWCRNSIKENMTMFPVHWELCKKHGVDSSDRWYEHTPVDVVENDEVELYWDLTIQKWTIIDIAVPSDFNVVRTKDQKYEKYPVIGALGTVSKQFISSICLGIADIIASTQMTAM